MQRKLSNEELRVYEREREGFVDQHLMKVGDVKEPTEHTVVCGLSFGSCRTLTSE